MRSELTSLRPRLAGCRYLLVSLAPFHRDGAGRVWLDPLWHRDLLAHLDYLSDVTVLSERAPMPPGGAADLVPVDPALMPRLRFLELPTAGSKARLALALPRMIATAVRAVRGADVVHSGVAGWPVPPGLLVNPLAVLMRRPLVIVVESAFWRLSGPGPHPPGARLRARAIEAFGRWSVRRARLGVFTQPEYRDQLGGGRGEAMVTPASLLDDEDVLAEPAVRAAWAAKGRAPRFVLAARLTAAKGVGVFLDALRMAEERGLPIDATLIGTGEMEAPARELAGRLRVARLAVLGPIVYGPAFLGFLRGFHAAVVPTVSDEQPRILFDAFSQGVPVLASDTAGNRGLVVPGRSGWLAPPGDAGALMRLMRGAVEDPAALPPMGLAARDVAACHTRHAMHLARARRLAALFGAPAEPSTEGPSPDGPTALAGRTSDP